MSISEDVNKQEYIITVYKFEEKDSLHNELITAGISPLSADILRKVDVVFNRTKSRNTHYLLTKLEVAELQNDPRIKKIELAPHLLGIKPGLFVETDNVESASLESLTELLSIRNQTSSDWDKSAYDSSTNKNWALLRCYEGQQRPGWGHNQTQAVTGTIELAQTGRNVDVIICDGNGLVWDHPEYAVNADGTGGTRTIKYNWFQHNEEINHPSPNGYYTYGIDLHATHVAGTVAGNTQGWARSANIYNLYLNAGAYNDNTYPWVFDYIRAFHENKPINPVTGRKNPTIVNNSWGMSIFPDDWSFADITQVTYRGQVYNTGSGFDAAQLNSWGFIAGQRIPQRVSALDADIQDAIDEGIIIVGAAGNGSWKHDIPGGPDWDNSFQMAYRYPGQTFYYMRGASPTANDQNINGGFDIVNICVGAIDSNSVDQKVTFSDCGPGVDIWAPGTNIISAIPYNGLLGVGDPRNNSFLIHKKNGTSMASPQVCGVIACALELYPNMKQADAKAYILFHAKTNQLTNLIGGPTNGQDLQGAANKFLYYYKERNTQGNIFPKINYKPRPSTGAVFPRTRIKRTI